MKKFTYTFLLFTLFLIQNISAQSKVEQHADYEGVKSAITDYVEALYEADTTKIVRSVHPELRKRGYWFNSKKQEWHDDSDMTYQQLINLTAKWNTSGKSANADSPKVIEIYDINERTASGKLIAEWGMDYFQLAKYEDKWMIVNILWQSLPEKD